MKRLRKYVEGMAYGGKTNRAAYVMELAALPDPIRSRMTSRAVPVRKLVELHPAPRVGNDRAILLRQAVERIAQRS